MRTTLLYISNALSVAIYFFLAAYLLLSRRRDYASMFLVAISIAIGFQGIAFLYGIDPFSSGSISVPWVLRLRWALGSLTPVLFHFVALSNREPPRAWPLWRYLTGLVLAGMSLTLPLLGEPFFEQVFNRGQVGGFSQGVILTPLGEMLMAAVMAYTLLITLPSIYGVYRRADTVATKGDARRLLYAYSLIVASWVAGIVANTLPQSTAVSATIGLVQRVLVIGAGLVLSLGVLRYGSPAGDRLPPRFLPSAWIGGLFLAAHLSILVMAPQMFMQTHLIPLMAISILVGAILGRAEQGWPRLFSYVHKAEKEIDSELRLAWRLLADGQPAGASLKRVRQLLDSELEASYIAVMLATEHRARTIVRSENRRIELEHTLAERSWPIAVGARDESLTFEGFEDRPAWLFPIRRAGSWLGVLALSPPQTGGVYGEHQLSLAAEYADLLAYAIDRQSNPIIFSEKPSEFKHLADEDEAQLRIYSLGRFEVSLEDQGRIDNKHLPLRAWQVLAHLVAALGELVPSDKLKVQLWPETDESSATNNLHVAVHALRRWLSAEADLPEVELLVNDRGSYRLNLEAGLVWLDALAYRHLYQRGKALLDLGAQPEAAQAYQAAVELYQGGFLDHSQLSLPAEIEIRRHRFELNFSDMTTFLIAWHLEQGDLEPAEMLLLRVASLDGVGMDTMDSYLKQYAERASSGKAQSLKHALDRVRDQKLADQP